MGFPTDDIDTLAYPNTIHMIAELSVKHDPDPHDRSRGSNSLPS